MLIVKVKIYVNGINHIEVIFMFAKRLNDLIEDRDINQKEMCAEIGITEQQMIRWKQGKSEAGITKLEALCKYFNVSADYLLGLPEGMPYPKS